MLKGKKSDHLLIISILTLVVFVILFFLRRLDDNRLTSWHWVFDSADASKIYLILFAGIVISYFLSKISLHRRYSAAFLFLSSFAISMFFWREPEVIVDSSRYFTQAKHLETYGISYFIREWGKDIVVWTDLPIVPFFYGLIFKFFGESRLYIQVFTTLLFSSTVVLTCRIGKSLWDKDTGFYAGMLLLGIPYIFTQVPLMLVDIPAMFFLTLSIFSFIRAIDKGGPRWIALSSIAIFLTFFSKYSTWLMLSALIVIFLVYLITSGVRRSAFGVQQNTPNYIYRGTIVALISVLLIGVVFLYKLDVFSEQIKLLLSYQRPGLKRWEEGFISTFFFQIHPFITIAASYSVYAAFRKRDLKYAIIIWLVLLVVLLQVKRIRYIIMVFPMVALMASYGLRVIKDKEIRRFIVLCAVMSSLAIAIFGYLPFVRKISVVNLKYAGEFLDTINRKDVEVFIMPYNEPVINPAVSVPILDLFTKKNIIYQYDDTHFLRPGEDIERSPLRFTWEYKNPKYYTNNSGDSKKAMLVITSEPERALPIHIEQKAKTYKNSKVFGTSEGVFQYRTIVTVYYN